MQRQRPPRSPLAECEESGFRVFDEGAHLGVPGPKQPRDVSSRAVAEPHPDHFRRWAAQHAEALEILVLRDQNEISSRGLSPDCLIASTAEAEGDDVRGVWV